jgi:hypothetical protein
MTNPLATVPLTKALPLPNRALMADCSLAVQTASASLASSRTWTLAPFQPKP